MIIIDLFDIDIHIFTVIKILFNLGVRFNYKILKFNFYDYPIFTNKLNTLILK